MTRDYKQPDVTLYGVYVPGKLPPQAQFLTQADADEWATQRYGPDGYYLQLNAAFWWEDE